VVVSYVFVGAYTWWLRPRSRFGLYLVGVGLTYSVASLNTSGDELVHTIGRAMLAALVVCLTYVFLCFPYDRLRSRLERRLVGWLALTSAVLWFLALAFVAKLPAAGPLLDCGSSCPDNTLRIATAPHALSSAINMAVAVTTAIGLIGAAGVLLGKARSPARLRRRLVVPLLCSIIVLAIDYAAFTVLREAGVSGLEVLKTVGAASALAIPLAMLLGQVRGRVFAATRLGRLVARMGNEPATPARVETILRDALGDPMLRLTLWDPGSDGYVDVQGGPVELPAGRPELGVTLVERSGKRVAALVHDAALDEASGITEGFAATSLLLLDNTDLTAELKASRARIVASAQQERLRLERNLHDGAQQRLFGIQLKLSAMRAQVADERLARDLDEVVRDAAAAVEELRALAHGIYPTVLRERGLGDALRSFALTASVPVSVVDRSAARCSATVEEAVYFCVLEAIQNAAKHGGPAVRVTVTLESRGADLEFVVADDGVGFRPGDAAGGVGLTSIRDRVGAVGGELEIRSQPGRGTTVRGVVPGDGGAPDAWS
jgi:signal transduction histidine kinase